MANCALKCRKKQVDPAGLRAPNQHLLELSDALFLQVYLRSFWPQKLTRSAQSMATRRNYDEASLEWDFRQCMLLSIQKQTSLEGELSVCFLLKALTFRSEGSCNANESIAIFSGSMLKIRNTYLFLSRDHVGVSAKRKWHLYTGFGFVLNSQGKNHLEYRIRSGITLALTEVPNLQSMFTRKNWTTRVQDDFEGTPTTSGQEGLKKPDINFAHPLWVSLWGKSPRVLEAGKKSKQLLAWWFVPSLKVTVVAFV